MQLKRLLSLLCVAVLIVTAVVFPVSAADNGRFELGVEVGTDTPISANPMIIKAGDKVTVSVYATENTGVSLLAFEFYYNTEALVFESLNDAELFGNVSDIRVDAENGVIRYYLTSNFITGGVFDVTENEGLIFDVTFTAVADFDGAVELTTNLLGNDANNCIKEFGTKVPFVAGNAVFELHDIIAEEGIVTDPTCLEDGYTTYTCSKHEDVVIGNIVDALGHDYVQTVVDPTCVEDGYTINTCSRCEDTYNDAVVPAFGHTLTNYDAKEGTCTEIGWDAYEACSVCDYTTYVEIPAPGHDIVVVEAQDATCTEIGWEAYEYCTVCDYTTYCEISALGHVRGDSVVENRVKATCTEDGHYDKVYYCVVCGGEESRRTITTTATGHNLVDHEAKEATCTEIGWNAYQTCTKCDYSTYA
ncbi:MAG: hypothetical protein IKU19_08240, partial [Clostridia bacterium]|nr:hypothetical protein [Clostridia bacterium]